jgi:phage-related protein
MYEVGLLDDAVEFLNSLDPKMRAKAFRTIDLLRNFGIFLKMPHAKKIEGEESLFELRVQLASNIVRLFYFHHLGKAYIITSGYVKKNMKLDRKEIDKARTIRAKFLQGGGL